MLEKTSESPLDCKEIQLVNPEGDQSWIFSGRTGAEAPMLWPPDVKKWLIWKDPHAGKDWRQEETGSTEDEMVGWHHRLNGHEFEQAQGIGEYDVLQSMGSERVGHDWATELKYTQKNLKKTVSKELKNENNVSPNILSLYSLTFRHMRFVLSPSVVSDSFRPQGL